MLAPEETAEAAGLHYVTDKIPGIRRKKRGKGFTYHDEAKDEAVSCLRTLTRIKDLVIPPAWEKVWICKDPQGHLQVTGYDKRGRKQYRYHPRWNEERNSTKFSRMIELADSLPSLRRRINQDLRLAGLPREKVLAAIIKIMVITQTRVGNALYAEENDSYGLTTLLNEHATVRGSKIKLSFKGKSGIDHDIRIVDKRLSRIIARCQELPGEELFCYVSDNGESVDVSSGHVNAYLKEVTGKDFTAKDLRTWGGTTKALELLVVCGPCEDSHASVWKKRHASIVKETARHLRNTVAVCRKYYIHPVLFEADQTGNLHLKWKRCRQSSSYSREEKLLLVLLKEAEKKESPCRARLSRAS